MVNELTLASILALPVISLFSIYFGVIGLKSLSNFWG